MIKKECFSKEWYNKVANQLGYNDIQLIEKVVRALSLLELLAQSGCPFHFKGGTATMVLLGGATNRLSIDIDIICPPGIDIEQYLLKFQDFGFTRIDLLERKTPGKSIPKSHSKFFYQVSYTNKGGEGYILLDVLYEESQYKNTLEIPIQSPFIEIEGEPSMVRIPSIEDILGDKLTAFAPNTTGIPYHKGLKVCSVEIIKQLYDIGRLFERVDNIEIISEVFHRTVKIEMAYRNIHNLEDVYIDIIQTCLLIATRGIEGTGDFKILSDGIKQIRNYIYKATYHIDQAIIDSSRAAYLSTCIRTGIKHLEKYSPNTINIYDIKILYTLPPKLNKLRRVFPEAYYYWAKTSELLVKLN